MEEACSWGTRTPSQGLQPDAVPQLGQPVSWSPSAVESTTVRSGGGGFGGAAPMEGVRAWLQKWRPALL